MSAEVEKISGDVGVDMVEIVALFMLGKINMEDMSDNNRFVLGYCMV